MYKRLIASAFVFGAAALAPPVEAQGLRCLPRETLVETLSKQYNEQLTGGGLQNAQRLLEVWSSEETGSFTVFITRPNGLSCIMATGQYWNTAVNASGAGVAG